MNCKQCGFEVEEGKKFCPNCGSPLEEIAAVPETAIPEAVPEETPDAVSDNYPTPDSVSNNIPNGTSSTANPIPGAVPNGAANPIPGAVPNGAANPIPGAVPNGAANPIPGAVPNGAAYQPIPPMNQPPKKKKKIWLIVLLICIPVLIIIIVVACLFGYGVSVGKQGAEAVNAYWDAYVDGSAEEFAKMVPEEYWDYISDTYDVTKEEAIAGMDLYLQEISDDLGGDLSYEWSQTAVQFGSGSSDNLKEVRELTDKYGLDISSGIGVSMKATVTGAEDDESHNFAIWSVKIDGEWYNVSAMSDFDSVCMSDYASAAKYQVEYGETMNAYWNAVINADAAALSEFMPEKWWDFISGEYSLSQSEAEKCLEQYLTELVSSEYDASSDMRVEVSVTDVEAYEESELTDLNDGLEAYGLSGDEAQDVYMYLTIINGETQDEDSSYVTMTHIDGSWYIYDAMYYSANACYLYAE